MENTDQSWGLIRACWFSIRKVRYSGEAQLALTIAYYAERFACMYGSAVDTGFGEWRWLMEFRDGYTWVCTVANLLWWLCLVMDWDPDRLE